jgi:predicted transcriptional regulator
VKRDQELLRQLLFEYEAQDDWLIIATSTLSMTSEARIRMGHLKILCDAGFVTPVGRDTYRLTNAGHDYLDAVRDEGIWKRTSDAVAQTGGSVTLEVLKALAVGFTKKQISERTGIEL